MNILAFDTCSSYCSVALKVGSDLFTRIDNTKLSHSKYLLGFINSVLSDAKIEPSMLDAISLTCGPGSFTGIRIGIAVAQGIGFGNDIKIVPISSLALVASATRKQLIKENKTFSYVLATLDARMNQLYGGWYDLRSAIPSLIGREWVLSPEKLPEIDSHGFSQHNGFNFKTYIHDRQNIDLKSAIIISGTGLEYLNNFPQEYIDISKNKFDNLQIHAADLIPVSEDALNKNIATSAEGLQPVYIRDNVVS